MKDQVVSEAKNKFMAGLDSSLTSSLSDAYEGGAKDQADLDGGATQSQVDDLSRQLADTKASLNAAILQDQEDVKKAQEMSDQAAALSAQVDSLNKRITALTEELGADDKIVKGFQKELAAFKAIVSALEALQPVPDMPSNPTPITPPPADPPAPVDPAPEVPPADGSPMPEQP